MRNGQGHLNSPAIYISFVFLQNQICVDNLLSTFQTVDMIFSIISKGMLLSWLYLKTQTAKLLLIQLIK